MKPVLLGLFLATPAFAAWLKREPSVVPGYVQPVAHTRGTAPATVRMPVEVLEKGSAARWVYVEVAATSVPEPGLLPLALATGAMWLLIRRR